jgi:hypothetical protein
LKEEALDRIRWRHHFGRGCGPVVTDYWWLLMYYNVCHIVLWDYNCSFAIFLIICMTISTSNGILLPNNDLRNVNKWWWWWWWWDTHTVMLFVSRSTQFTSDGGSYRSKNLESTPIRNGSGAFSTSAKPSGHSGT